MDAQWMQDVFEEEEAKVAFESFMISEYYRGLKASFDCDLMVWNKDYMEALVVAADGCEWRDQEVLGVVQVTDVISSGMRECGSHSHVECREGQKEDEVIYCRACQMCLNGHGQWLIHVNGRKHKKYTRSSPKRQETSKDNGSDKASDVAALAPKVVICNGQHGTYRYSATGEEVSLPEGCGSKMRLFVFLFRS